ncbi:transcriptional regulator [Cryobacterium sp. TMT1-2-2]|uniref:transcriptional regulator n=1 Tax=Cryobacterium sp. TMT1-2-2 TaxID=1259233 RepID=UPI0021063B95|nr:transcriptional regulator [Cryobacterium sp. TMT1-2-2]
MGTESNFDDAIHAPTRLRLCAMLRPIQAVEFSALTEMLQVSEANLSKTIRSLAEIGYISTSKQTSPERADSRRTTTVWLTSSGRRAFDGHLGALLELSAHSQTQ